jgi:hypothetical protein
MIDTTLTVDNNNNNNNTPTYLSQYVNMKI